jgi:hypothetical protein
MTELCGAGAKWLKAASESHICFCYPLILPVSTAIARFRPLFARFRPLFDPSFLCPQSPPFPPLFPRRFLPRLSPALPSAKASSWYPHPLFSRCYWICLVNCVFCRSKPMPSSKVPLPQLKHAHNPPERNPFLRDVHTAAAAYRALVCAFAWRRVLDDSSVIGIIAPLFSRVFCPALDAQAVPGNALLPVPHASC